jgi:hypothetical protein
MRDKSKFQNQRRGSEQSGGSQIVGHGANNGAGMADHVMENIRAAKEKVMQTTGKMSSAIGQTLKEEGERLFEKKKGRVVSRISGAGKLVKQVAHALRAVKADGVAQMVEQTADSVEDATHYLEDATLQQVVEDTGQIVREHQALAVGGLFVVGFAASRFLKAGGSRSSESGSELGESDENESE